MSVEYTFIKENKCHDLSTASLRVAGFSAMVCGGRDISRRGEIIMLPPFLQGQRRCRPWWMSNESL